VTRRLWSQSVNDSKLCREEEGQIDSEVGWGMKMLGS
jgi:hypothetical protein